MLNIGEKCIHAEKELLTYLGKKINLLQYKNKVILLTFIDIIKGWNWLENLYKIEKELLETTSLTYDDFQIFVVVFNYGDLGEEKINKIKYNGPVSPDWIQDKITSLNLGFINFPIVVNGPWSSSLASDYEYAFSRDIDHMFNGNTGGEMFSYLLTEDLVVADKWTINSTNNNDPVSFNSLILNRGGNVITGISETDGTVSVLSDHPEGDRVEFYSSLFYNVKAFLIERIKNLATEPLILYTVPPLGSGIKKLNIVKIVFSKPVREGEANNPENFTITGGGSGSLKVVSASYKERDKIENVVTLEIEGTAVSNLYDDSIIISINRARITDTSGNRIPPEKNTIKYKADITNPEVSSLPDYSKLILGDDKKERINSIIIRFSKKVINAVNPNNYSFSVDGIEVFHIMELDNNEFMLNIKIHNGTPLKNGDIVTITLDEKNIVDLSGNPLSGNKLSLKIYDECPSLIMDYQESQFILGPGLANGVNYSELEYSEEVKGANDPENYTFSDNNVKVIEVKELEDNKYRLAITVTDPLLLLSSDNVVLNINNDNVVNAYNNSLTNNRITYRVDFSHPELTALNFDLNTVLGSNTIKGHNTTKIKFSKEVIGADNPAHYKFSEDFIAATRVISLPNNEYELIIFFASVSHVKNDDIVKLIPDFRKITDKIGNTLKETAISYTINTNRPSVKESDSTKKIVLGIITKRRTCYQKISFTEDVLGAENPNNYTFSIKGLSVIDIVQVDQSNYELCISVEENIPVSHGDEIIMILNIEGITNKIGNKLLNNIVTLTVDTIPPAIKVNPPINSIINSLEKLEISFSKKVLGADKWRDNYEISGAYGNLQICNDKVHDYDPTTDTATIIFDGNFEEGIEKDFIDITLNNITDEAGNILVNNKISYQLDTVHPEMMSFSNFFLGASLNTNINVRNIRFTKPMLGADNPDNYSFSTDGISLKEIKPLTETEFLLSILVENNLSVSHKDKVTLKLDSKITDYVGNKLKNTTAQFIIDKIPPKIKPYPQRNSRINSLHDIEIVYSKDVVGADKWHNYILRSSLDVIKINQHPVHSYDENSRSAVIRLIGNIPEGTDNQPFELIINDVTDIAGNHLIDNIITYYMDTVRPSLIATDNPVLGAYTTGGNNIKYIKFSKPVIGATHSFNYSFSREGISVTGIEKINSSEYKLTINISAPHSFNDADSVTLTLDSNNITDDIGNRLENNTLTFTIYSSRPEVMIYPEPGTRLNSLNELTISFSKTVLNADISNNYYFTESIGNLKVSPSFAREYDPSGKNLTLKIIGSPPEGLNNKPITLVLRNITDKAGNRLQKNSFSFILDTVCPTLENLPTAVLGSKTEGGLNTYNITISKPVKGIDNVSNFSFLNNSISLKKITHRGKNEYQLLIQVEPYNKLLNDEKVDLIIKNENIIDDVGNALDRGKITFKIDTVSPAIQLNPSSESTLSSLTKIEFEFTKDVNGADIWTSYILKSSIKELYIDPEYKHTYDSSNNKGVLYISGEIPEGINDETVEILISGISDKAGNLLDNNTISYTINTIRPSVIGPDYLKIGTSTEEGKYLTQIRFTKDVIGAEEPSNYEFSREGIEVNKATRKKQFEYELQFNITKPEILDHKEEVILVLNKNNISDTIGNPLNDNTITFMIDAEKPTFTSEPAPGSRINLLTEIRIQYSKDVMGADIFENNYNLRFSKTIGNIHFAPVNSHKYNKKNRMVTLKCAGKFYKTVKDKKIELLLNSIKDRSGNLLAPDRITYIVDMENPTVEFLSGFTLNADILNNVTKIRYSKEVIGADDPLNYKFSKNGIDITEINELGNNEYNLIIQISDDTKIKNGDSVDLFISDHITDLANNILIYKAQKLSIIKIKASDTIIIADIATLVESRVPSSIDHNTGSLQFPHHNKQVVLIEKIIFNYIKLWKTCLVTDDRIGIIFINKGTDTGLKSSYKDLVYIDDIIHKGINDMSQIAWSSGEIKKGIKKAHDLFKNNSDPNREQSIILITANAGLYPEIEDMSEDTIPVYTVGIGDSLSLKGQDSITGKRKGTHLSGQSLWQDLLLYLCSHFTSIQSKHGLQIMHFNEDRIRVDKDYIKKEQFRVSTSTKKITILVSWFCNEPLGLKLDNGIETICHMKSSSKGFNYSLINIFFSSNHDENALPYNKRSTYIERKKKLGIISKKRDKEPNYLKIIYNKSIKMNNSWSIKIEGDSKNKNDIPYQIVILAQDPAITYELKDPDKPVKTGDTIKTGIQVFENGKPARMNYTVEGVIASPEYGKNRIFYEYFAADDRIKPIKEKLLKGISRQSRNKLHINLLNLIQDEKTVIEQTRRYKKEYMEFTKKNISSKKKTDIDVISRNLAIPGLYRIDYHIKGRTDQYGFYERFICRTVNVDLKADKKNTEIFAEYFTKTRQVFLTIIPNDKYGNLLGPDRSDLITGKICGKEIKNIVDNLDGSYLAIVRIAKKEDIKNRKSSIYVYNVNVYNGPTSKLISDSAINDMGKNRLN